MCAAFSLLRSGMAEIAVALITSQLRKIYGQYKIRLLQCGYIPQRREVYP